MTAANPLQFKSFRSRIITYLVILLLIVLGTVFFSVNRSTYNNTRSVIDSSLLVSQGVFTKLLQEREENFKDTFSALAADFAFRTAYSTADYDTLLSAGENLLARTENADMLMIVDYDYLMVADTLRLLLPETDFPWAYLLEAAEGDEEYEATSFILIESIAYHVVAVPILTPLIDGWIIVGQRLDEGYVNSLKEITTTDMSILLENTQGAGEPLATTLDSAQASELGSEFNAYFAGEANTGMLDLNGEEFAALRTSLVDRPEISLSALVQQSLPEALAPYRELEQRLVVLFALGLCLSAMMALFLGRSVSNPVLALVNRVKKIELGDYAATGSGGREDEIGQLEISVDNMATGLAEKEKVRDLLGKVVSKEIAEELMGSEVILGGESRTATILFSDIRDFTNLCEGREPKSILTLLNNYLSVVSSAIEDNKGVVDKYIGDAVMALFGVPLASDNDTGNALNAALAMRERITLLNTMNQQQHLPLLHTGIGLHTGNVVAGNLGSTNRLNYTVIGDAVNLASRLESLTKQYGVDILVSEDTRTGQDNFVFKELDLVRVKGKAQPVKVYELVCRSTAANATLLQEISEFEEVLTHYRQQRWKEALSLLDKLSAQQRLLVLDLYRERIAFFKDCPPDTNWDGVFTYKEK